MSESRQQLIVGNFEPTPPLVTRLDMREDLSFPIKFKVSEIRDLKKRQGAHSPQAITLPGTEVNNRFFGGLYDIGADFTIFNPNQKVDCKLIIDGQEEINGFLQLKEVRTNRHGDTVYDITVFDQVSSFYRQIKDKKVIDIDFSDLDHTLNLTSLQSSWSGTWDVEGFFYPYMKDVDTSGVRKIEKFQPAIYEKLILDRMIEQAHPDYPLRSFTWSGTLKANSTFEREIIPYSGDKPTVDEATANSKFFYAGLTLSTLISDLNPAPSSGIMSSFSTHSPLPFDDETTAPFDDSNNIYAGNIMTAPIDGIYKFDCNLGIGATVDYTTSGSDDKPSELRFSLIGGLEIRDGVGNLVNPITLSNQGINKPYEIYSQPGDNEHSTLQQGSVFSVKMTTTSDGSHTLATVAALPNVTGDFQGEEEGGGIFMLSGWTARINFRYQTTGHRFIGETGINPNLTIDRIRIFLRAGSTFRSQKIQSGYVANQTIEMNNLIDANLKQKDILEDIIARYNCYIYTNPDDENDIVFDMRDDFYASGPVLDWTNKRTNKNQEKIVMIGELQNAEFFFSYKKASDAINKTYSDLTNQEIYGQFKFLFSNEFVKGQKKVQTPFEPTPFVRQVLDIVGTSPNYSEAIVPAINVTEPKTGFRVLYARQNLLTDDVSVDQDGSEVVKWILKSKSPTTGLTTLTDIVGYPYAGHYDHPINPTVSLNFGNPKVVLAEMPTSLAGTWTPTANTLFQLNWRNTMQQIARGQMLIDEFDLTPEDISRIRRNPNAKIFVENQYYFINQVIFEGNQNLTKLARVELITVEGDINLPSGAIGFNGSFSDSPIDAKNPPDKDEGSSNNSAELIGNTAGRNTQNNSTRGQGNNTGSGTKNVTIIGNNNTVDSNFENVVIENGDNNYVKASNVTIKNRSGITVETEGIKIDGNSITINGKTATLFNKVDGGFNVLRNPFSKFNENLIEGGKNQVQDPFSETVINKIDSDDGINNII